MKKITVLLSLLCVFLGTRALHAQISLGLSDVVVSAGDTAVVTASISNSGSTPVSLSAYNIPLDISNLSGFTFAGASSITSATNSLSAFAAEPAAAAANLNYDFNTSDSGGSLLLSATPTALFEISFLVDANAAAGSVLPVSIETNPTSSSVSGGFPVSTLFSLTLNGDTLDAQDIAADVVVSSGSITVVAVPEPSTASLLGLVALVGLSLRRRH